MTTEQIVAAVDAKTKRDLNQVKMVGVVLFLCFLAGFTGLV